MHSHVRLLSLVEAVKFCSSSSSLCNDSIIAVVVVDVKLVVVEVIVEVLVAGEIFIPLQIATQLSIKSVKVNCKINTEGVLHKV